MPGNLGLFLMLSLVISPMGAQAQCDHYAVFQRMTIAMSTCRPRTARLVSDPTAHDRLRTVPDAFLPLLRVTDSNAGNEEGNVNHASTIHDEISVQSNNGSLLHSDVTNGNHSDVTNGNTTNENTTRENATNANITSVIVTRADVNVTSANINVTTEKETHTINRSGAALLGIGSGVVHHVAPSASNSSFTNSTIDEDILAGMNYFIHVLSSLFGETQKFFQSVYKKATSENNATSHLSHAGENYYPVNVAGISGRNDTGGNHLDQEREARSSIILESILPATSQEPDDVIPDIHSQDLTHGQISTQEGDNLGRISGLETASDDEARSPRKRDIDMEIIERCCSPAGCSIAYLHEMLCFK